MSEVEPWLSFLIPGSGRLALDVGANEGSWTGVLADRFIEVHAFEPNPDVLPQLRGHVLHNANVWLIEMAIGAEIGDVTLNLYASHEQASFYGDDELDTASRGRSRGTAVVPMTSLDALGYEDKNVDFVKIDTEGAEVLVIRGARRMLAACAPELLIEVHSLVNLSELEGILTGTYNQIDIIPHPHAGVHPGHCWIHANV